MTQTENAYTVRELANACGCSRQTINKHLTSKSYQWVTNKYKGREVRAYVLSLVQLEQLKELINNNKELSGGNCQRLQPVDNNFFKEYAEAKELLAVTKERLKLLEDRQGGLIQEVREKETEIKNQCQRIGSLESDLKSAEQTVKDYKEAVKKYKKIIIALGAVLAVVLGLLIVKLILI